MRTAGLDELQPLLQSHTFHDGAPSDLASLGPSDVLFWGFSPVAPLHFGYDKLFFTIASLQRASGCKVILFVADTYARLSRPLTVPTSTIADYYRRYIEDVWSIHAEWVLASDVIRTPEYIDALLAVAAQTRLSVVKDSWTKEDRATSYVYGALYPLMQVLDVCIIKPTVVFAEESQEKFYRLLPNVAAVLEAGLATTFLFTAQSPDLRGKPLKGSTGRDRLSLHESPESLRRKLSTAATLPGSDRCPVSELLLYSIWPFSSLDTLLADRFTDVRQQTMKGVVRLPENLDLLVAGLRHRVDGAAAAFTRPPTVSDWIDVTRLRAE